jgi:hypothetical protein
MSASWTLFRIEIDDGTVELKLPGLVSAGNDDRDFHLTLVRDLPERIDHS